MPVHLTLLYTVSTDGFIATKHDQSPWLPASWEEYLNKCRDVGHLIMGRRTFDFFRSDPSIKPEDFTSLTVLSNSNLTRQPSTSFFVSPQDAVEHLHRNNVTNAILLGGAKAATSFLEQRLISEIHLDRNPILLGEGIPMFHPLRQPTCLRLQSSVASSDGRTREVYRVIPSS